MTLVNLLLTRLNRIKWRVIGSVILLMILLRMAGSIAQPSVKLAWTLPRYISESAFTSDGQSLITREAIDEGSLITIWEAHTGQKIKERTFDTGITVFDLSPDESTISIVTDKGTLIAINAISLETETQTDIVDPQHNRLQNILYSPTGQIICLIGLEYGDKATSFAQIYDTQTGKRVALLEWAQNFFEPPAAFNADGTRLAIGTNPTDREGILRVWDTNSWQEILNTPSSVIMSLAWSPDDNSITLGLAPGDMETLNVTSLDKTLAVETPSGITHLAYSLDGCLLFYSGLYVGAQVMDSQTGNLVAVLSNVEGTGVDITLSPKGDLMLIGQFSFTDKSPSTSAIWNVSDYPRCL